MNMKSKQPVLNKKSTNKLPLCRKFACAIDIFIVIQSKDFTVCQASQRSKPSFLLAKIP